MIITLLSMCKYQFTYITHVIYALLSENERCLYCKYVHIHVHLSITVCTIGSSPKIYQKVTDISDELIQNLYIQSQKPDYMEMKISVNDHHTPENV